MDRQQYNERFKKLMDGLNPAQREAAEHLEGPVLVVAGPGTGKTHLLTARVGNILMETDAQAHNILCLTFSDAGAQAMRQRLLQFIGPEAHRVPIQTFHSFCNGVIRDHLEVFGHQDLQPLTELERVDIVRTIIDDLPPEHPLMSSRWDPYYYEKHLRHLFQTMKAENWSAELLCTKADEYQTRLPELPGFRYQRNYGSFKKGDLKEGEYKKAVEKLDKLRAGARLLEAYERLLLERRRYDYEDMLQWVLRAFSTNENLLRYYQERYLYYLVDEFQDTNGAQLQLLYHLTNFWEAPNLFVVGDDDQSIFEFQGARLRNVGEFAERFREDLKVVPLVHNYRSAQIVLDLSKDLIDRNELRLIKFLSQDGFFWEKKLVAKNPFAQSTVAPVWWTFPNRAQEEAGIAAEIERLHHELSIPYHEIAVLYAKHKQAANLLDLLEKKRIPYQTRRRVNVLDLKPVEQLLNMLQYLDRQNTRPGQSEGLLFEILHYGCWDNDPLDLVTLATLRERHHTGYLDLLDRTPQKQFRRPETLTRSAETLLALQRITFDLSLHALVEQLINRGGLLEQALRGNDSYTHVQALGTFHRFVTEECERNPRMRIGELLNLIAQMRANKIALELEKVVSEGEGVHLLTAFAAKGLEFRAVFLLDCSHESWDPSSKGGKQFSFPPTLTESTEETNEREAARRLFYVALTRAKAHLYLTVAQKNAANKDIAPSEFISELEQSGKLAVEARSLPNDQMLEVQKLVLGTLPPQGPARLSEDQLRKKLENFQLSPSSMNSLLKCPLAFYYQTILRVPTGSSEVAVYGNAVHRTLQWVFNQLKANAPAQDFPTIEQVLERFGSEMDKAAGDFSQSGFQRHLRVGRQLLPLYYAQRLEEWDRQADTEKNLRQVTFEGIPIQGTIDKIVVRPNGDILLADYKTGKTEAVRYALPNEKEPLGGEYWRQMMFYKVLYENSPVGAGKTAHFGEIDYLTQDDQGRFPIVRLAYSADAVDRFRGIIGQAWQRIQSLDFFNGCGKKECVWCQFERKHLVPDSFAEELLEDLDDD
jgi:DNA helicase-2/ATP-dependent DNA helicase PcrA